MGGVPVLMLIAAIGMGITYGWQPDQSGESVEYLIQVSPDQIDDLKRAGEISSGIDPAVRGYVSKVVIRIGDEDLPRDLPDNLAAADRQSIPMPEIDASGKPRMTTPGPQLFADHRASPAGSSRVMKPLQDVPPTGGGGFTFPDSMPPSLAEAAAAVKQNVDQAGREIQNSFGQPFDRRRGQTGAGNQNGSNFDNPNASLIPPPGTRSTLPPNMSSANAQSQSGNPNAFGGAGNFSPPAFTGPPAPNGYGGTGYGGTGYGGTGSSMNTGNSQANNNPNFRANGNAGSNNWPPSTDPNQRDNTWTDYAGSSSQGPTTSPPSMGSRSSGPSTNSRSTSTASPFAGGANGLRPSDTFGRTPAGISPPVGFGGNSSFATNNPAATNNQAPRSPATASGATQSRGPETSTRLPNGQITDATPTSPDSRLTNAQVNVGAWSVDQYGRILDRKGMPMNDQRLQPPSWPSTTAFASSGNPANVQPASAGGYSNPPNSNNYGNNNYDPNRTWQADPQSSRNDEARFAQIPTASSRWDTQAGAASPTLPTFGNPNTNRNPGSPAIASANNGGQTWQNGPFTQQSPPNGSSISASGVSPVAASSSDRFPNTQASFQDSARQSRPGDQAAMGTGAFSNQTSTGGANGSEPRQEVAGQRLSNGLLLFSIVANIYFIYWLKNLRLQYHDMVAAKRMASNGGVAA